MIAGTNHSKILIVESLLFKTIGGFFIGKNNIKKGYSL